MGRRALVVMAVLGGIAATLFSARDPQSGGGATGGREGTYTVVKRDFVRSLRLSGTVEAVESTTVAAPVFRVPTRPRSWSPGWCREAPRSGPVTCWSNSIARPKITAALDRRAELEMAKNEMIPKIQAEKNTQALEQAQARREQLKKTYELKRKAAQADIRILEGITAHSPRKRFTPSKLLPKPQGDSPVVYGVAPGYVQIASLKVVSGRFFDDAERRGRRRSRFWAKRRRRRSSAPTRRLDATSR